MEKDQDPYHWIDEFELYKDLYKEDNRSIKLHFVYLNNHNEIEHRKEHIFFLHTHNVLQREEIIPLLKQYSFTPTRRYYLLSLLVFHIDIDPHDLLQQPNPFWKDPWRKLNTVMSIPLPPTVSMFQDLNEIVFLLTPVPVHHAQTKKIILEKHVKTYKKR